MVQLALEEDFWVSEKILEKLVLVILLTDKVNHKCTRFTDI